TLSRSAAGGTADVEITSESSSPATVWWLVVATKTLALQLLPPLVELKARIALELAEENGTITVPFGCTTGCPPRPLGLPEGCLSGPQARPPLVEVLMSSMSRRSTAVPRGPLRPSWPGR